MRTPTIVGICGGSASGKSTLAELLCSKIGRNQCAVLSMDSFYIDFIKRGYQAKEINFDQPESFDLDLLANSIDGLLHGKSVHIPVYDFGTHTRKSEMKILESKKFIIVEGLFLYTIPELANFFSLKLFIETPDDIRLIRRIERDRKQRDRKLSSILQQYTHSVRPMHIKYVIKNRDLADRVMRGDIPFEDQIPPVLTLLGIA